MNNSSPTCMNRMFLLVGCGCESEHGTHGHPETAQDVPRPFFGDPYGGFAKATLVICPLVAVIQWGQEIARFTAPGTLKVCIAAVWRAFA